MNGQKLDLFLTKSIARMQVSTSLALRISHAVCGASWKRSNRSDRSIGQQKLTILLGSYSPHVSYFTRVAALSAPPDESCASGIPRHTATRYPTLQSDDEALRSLPHTFLALPSPSVTPLLSNGGN